MIYRYSIIVPMSHTTLPDLSRLFVRENPVWAVSVEIVFHSGIMVDE